MDDRHDDIRIAGEVLAHALGRRSLALEVELELDEFGKLVDEDAQIETGIEPACYPHGAAKRAEVDRKQPRRLRVLHFDGDVVATNESGAMHLRQGRRRNRLRLDVCEHLADRLSELALDMSRKLRERPRRHAI